MLPFKGGGVMPNLLSHADVPLRACLTAQLALGIFRSAPPPMDDAEHP